MEILVANGEASRNSIILLKVGSSELHEVRKRTREAAVGASMWGFQSKDSRPRGSQHRAPGIGHQFLSRKFLSPAR